MTLIKCFEQPEQLQFLKLFSILGTSSTQSKHNQAAISSSFNSFPRKKGLSAETQSAETLSIIPRMCDQSTNTVSLSTLLHPEKTNTDCVDNKISECIVKLRQVCSNIKLIKFFSSVNCTFFK